MKAIKYLLILLLLVASPTVTASESGIHLDKAPVDLQNKASLQRGAKLFASRCLACHSASYMRYNRLLDIGMTAEQIKKDWELPEDVNLGSTMQAAMDSNSAKLAFGAAPPDLSVIARSRGADWLYTYMRTFYADPDRPNGWNNLVLPGVGMPFVLADLQGTQVLHVEKRGGHEIRKLVLETPSPMCTAGFSMCVAGYDAAIADLINYLVFMGDPSKMIRPGLGYIVLGFLFIFFVLIFSLKKEVWKDVH